MSNYGGVCHEGTWRVRYVRGRDCERFCPTVPRQDRHSPRQTRAVNADLDSAALRESLATRLSGLPEKPDANS